MYIVGYNELGQNLKFLRKKDYLGFTYNPEEARVFNKIGHVKSWANKKVRKDREKYLAIKIDIIMVPSETISIEDMYK